MEPQELAIDAKKLSKALDINIQAAYDLMHRDGFPAIRVSEKRIVVPLEALRKWLADPANFMSAEKSRG